MAIVGYPSPGSPPGGTSEGRGWGRGWPYCSEAGALQVSIQLHNGVRVTVREELADLVRYLLNYCLARGYVIRQADTGGYNCRPIRNSDPPRASNHSWGLAVDINWSSNVQYTTKTDIPPWMVSLLYAYGFYWGGWYASGYEDPMHFEFIRPPSVVSALTNRARQLWEAIMGQAQTEALIWNVASMVGALVQERTTADQKRFGETDAGQPGADLGLPIVTSVQTLKSNVAALGTRLSRIEQKIEAPAPVAVDVVDLAAALRPIIKQEVEKALGRRDVVAPDLET